MEQPLYLSSELVLEVEVRMEDGGIVAWKFMADDFADDMAMYIDKRGGSEEIEMNYIWETIPLGVARAFAGYFTEVVRRHDEHQRNARKE